MNAITDNNIQKKIRSHKATTISDGFFTAEKLSKVYSKRIDNHYAASVNAFNTFKLRKNVISVIQNFYADNLKDNGCVSLFMRILADKVDLVAAIDEDTFFDDRKSRALYKKASDVTKNNNHISISFMPCKDLNDINVNALASDYYIEIYKK